MSRKQRPKWIVSKDVRAVVGSGVIGKQLSQQVIYNDFTGGMNMSADQSRETETFNPEASGLTLRFADGFDQEFEASNHLDMAHWTNCQGGAKAENGCCVLDAVIAPGEWGDAGICTREKQFNPGLKGRNGAEVTFVGHTQGTYELTPHNQDHPEHIGDPLSGRYITGMCLTISNYHGPIIPDWEEDGESDDDEPIPPDLVSSYRASGKRRSGRRGVQIHFDWMSKWGLVYYLCRSILPEDYGKYPERYSSKSSMQLDSLEEFIGKGQYVGGAVFVLAARHSPGQAVNPLGRRYGLYLTDDGNTVSWTLDGKIMDTVDISGFFTSDPECVGDGAYISLSGAGYQPHLWMFDDLKVYSS
jgi:hypothetical protein